MFGPETNEVKIYTAGKTWAAHEFRPMREYFNITADWIDFQDVLASPDDEFSEEIHADEEYKRKVWDEGCKRDTKRCDMMVLLAREEDGEMHSGSLVELGHVTGDDKPCYILGTCKSFEPVGHSDRAWKSQSVVHYWPDILDHMTVQEAMEKAVAHYQQNYAGQWYEKNVIIPAAKQMAKVA